MLVVHVLAGDQEKVEFTFYKNGTKMTNSQGFKVIPTFSLAVLYGPSSILPTADILGKIIFSTV